MPSQRETLSYTGRTNVECRKICMVRLDDGHYVVRFIVGATRKLQLPIKQAVLTDAQFALFSIWLRQQPIRNFNLIVDMFAVHYVVGLGWTGNKVVREKLLASGLSLWP